MTTPIRIALVGMGKIARDQHVPTIQQDPVFQLVATVSTSGGSVDDLPAFASLEALAASGVAVDAVSLCTPPQVRRAIAHSAIDQGWAVFLEKPPAATVSEAIALRDHARARGTGLFASWHSRHAPAVEPARVWLADRQVLDASIIWAEDVRQWHPGQDWIFEPGGFGVFDPAINALSIATQILPQALFVEGAAIDVPSNRGAAIAADVSLRTAAGAPVHARLDFLQRGRQRWDIAVRTNDGDLLLSDGGAALSINGDSLSVADALHGEYAGLYRRFAEIVPAREVDMDLAPLTLVADIHLVARRTEVDAFDW
ncbi:D-galactose 1-dehydrogenase [Sphingomonas jejuensis]|uniref:D-galactose 1-dehydrogenase n=1 Tax=Sphingomonas jejuensis TaxID=904715 RepID=A0ABX0XL77_9SPHN|nr:D-galactose 1-dehydrogenase [Sphingomonas jejuensis]